MTEKLRTGRKITSAIKRGWLVAELAKPQPIPDKLGLRKLSHQPLQEENREVILRPDLRRGFRSRRVSRPVARTSGPGDGAGNVKSFWIGAV